jgi:hypothetical protein
VIIVMKKLLLPAASATIIALLSKIRMTSLDIQLAGSIYGD